MKQTDCDNTEYVTRRWSEKFFVFTESKSIFGIFCEFSVIPERGRLRSPNDEGGKDKTFPGNSC